jgi:fucose 4-O-acetylase-like acetyltransferase
MQSQTMRSASLDILRIAGVMAVVAGHVWGDVPLARSLIYSWQVPIFFVLSGYLDSARSIPAVVNRRARSMLLPHATWLIVITAIFPGLIPWQNLLKGGIYLPRPYSAFWFVTALFVAVVLAAVVRSWPLVLQWALAVVLVAVGTIWGRELAFVWWSAAIGAACFVFVVAGRTLRRMVTSSRIAAAVAAAILVGCIAAAAFGVTRPLDLKYGDFGTPAASVAVAIAISASLIVLAEHTFARLPAAAAAIATRVALGAFTVVLAHAAVLQLVAPLDRRLLSFLLALIIPWALALVLLRTPVALPFTGVERQPRLPSLRRPTAAA